MAPCPKAQAFDQLCQTNRACRSQKCSDYRHLYIDLVGGSQTFRVSGDVPTKIRDSVPKSGGVWASKSC